MTRTNEHSSEGQQARRHERVGKIADGGLESVVRRNGGELLGLSVRLNDMDCLMTLRAIFPAGRVVCFIGGDSLGSVMLKAYREGQSDNLRWKTDKYAK